MTSSTSPVGVVREIYQPAELAPVNVQDRVPVHIISYQDLQAGSRETQIRLAEALKEHGIVGVRGVPRYREQVLAFINSLRQFHALPEEIKQKYAPTGRVIDERYDFVGYDVGKEKFKREEGSWVVDNFKRSYYGKVPAPLTGPQNKVPTEVDLERPFQEIGQTMSQVGQTMMEMIGLTGANSQITLDAEHVGRMLYYSKRTEGEAPAAVDADCPLWCGAHFDHGIFTALLPAVYYDPAGNQIPEPEEAGLFVRITENGPFRKVVADDPDVLLFQVGEFGQLATNDAIRATEHRVHEARNGVERYTMALFFAAHPECMITSASQLKSDSRYGDGPTCKYNDWHSKSLARYQS